MKLACLNGEPEIFHTIQGEGKNLGKPSIFLRTSLCNLHCFWCDTDYTWNWEGTPFETTSNKKFSKEQYIIEVPLVEVYNRFLEIPCTNIVLTGGEPMMHQKDLIQLMSLLKNENKDYFFEVETNGTLLPSNEFESLINQYNVSPKLNNSKNPLSKRLKDKPLRYFSTAEKANFKFVISEKDDLTEVLKIIDDYKITADKVYLMPEGKTRQELSEKQRSLVDICKKYNFNYTDRLHIEIFGSKRGV